MMSLSLLTYRTRGNQRTVQKSFRVSLKQGRPPMASQSLPHPPEMLQLATSLLFLPAQNLSACSGGTGAFLPKMVLVGSKGWSAVSFCPERREAFVPEGMLLDGLGRV